MRWPWVSREIVDELKASLTAAENLRQFDRAALVSSEKLRIAAEERAAQCEAERKLLLDRIVQMTGQPALYEKAAPQPAVVGAESAQEAPTPTKLVTFDDVHSAARRALANGTYRPPAGRLN